MFGAFGFLVIVWGSFRVSRGLFLGFWILLKAFGFHGFRILGLFGLSGLSGVLGLFGVLGFLGF